MFVIKNSETGRYVAPPGRKHSYTQSIREARKFRDRAAAEAEACGNEVVLPLDGEILE